MFWTILQVKREVFHEPEKHHFQTHSGRKIAMIHAAGLFRSGAVKRLNIPSLVMSDGPSGVRQEFENDSWTPIDDTTDFCKLAAE